MRDIDRAPGRQPICNGRQPSITAYLSQMTSDPLLSQGILVVLFDMMSASL